MAKLNIPGSEWTVQHFASDKANILGRVAQTKKERHWKRSSWHHTVEWWNTKAVALVINLVGITIMYLQPHNRRHFTLWARINDQPSFNITLLPAILPNPAPFRAPQVHFSKVDVAVKSSKRTIDWIRIKERLSVNTSLYVVTVVAALGNFCLKLFVWLKDSGLLN